MMPAMAATIQPIDLRLRTRIHPDELAAKIGKIVTPGDYNVVLTGPARLLNAKGQPVAVYLPGALVDEMDAAGDVLRSIKMVTDNRGKASGTPRVRRGDQKRTRTRNILSATVGSVDPGPSSSLSGALPACRLTSWTAKHLAEWDSLNPLFLRIAALYQEHVPDRYQAQVKWANRTHPEWLIPGTPFTTVTVNNTYSTGVHQDAGDLEEGFSTLACWRGGEYTGGLLVLAEHRIAVDMRHGDLLLFDAHQWHGNTDMICPHQGTRPLDRPCPEGCERVSLVTYYRTKVQRCGTAAEEAQKVQLATSEHAEHCGPEGVRD